VPFEFADLTRTRSVCVSVAFSKASTGSSLEIMESSLQRVSSTMEFEPDADMLPVGSVVATVASFSERTHSLLEAVLSLYPFVCQIRVFFNGHNISSSHPVFQSPKVEIAYSATYDSQGDIGKFFWVDSDRSLFEYHLTFDDDILYPLEYSKIMTSHVHFEYQDRVILGVHGSRLIQPITSFNDVRIRTTFRFNQSLQRDSNVQFIGTGTALYAFRSLPVCYLDFEYHNMADIWLTLLSQRHHVPRVAIQRSSGWLQPIDGTRSTSIWKTIADSTHDHDMYSNLLKDSLFAQDYVIKRNFPLSAPSLKGKRLKLFLALTTWNRLEFLKHFLDSFFSTRSPAYDWILAIADDGSTDGTIEFLENLSMRDSITEIFILRNKGIYACGQTNELLSLAAEIDFDYGFKVEDDVIFLKKGWEKLYIDAIVDSGYQHICYLNLKHRKTLIEEQHLSPLLDPPFYDKSQKLVAYVDVWNGDGPFWTFTKEMIERVGFCDEDNFPIRGQWHIDLSLRLSRAGFTSIEHFYDAVGSNRYITLQVAQNRKNYKAALPWGAAYKKTKEHAELIRRYDVMKNDSRIFVGRPFRLKERERRNQLETKSRSFLIKAFSVTSEFDQWQSFNSPARSPGISFDREKIVDVNQEPYRSIYQSLMIHQQHHVFANNSIKVASPEAFSYSYTFLKTLKSALRDGTESLVLLNDGMRFHRNFKGLLNKISSQLPENWMIVFLDADNLGKVGSVDRHSKNLSYFSGKLLKTNSFMIRRTAFLRLIWYAMSFESSLEQGSLARLCLDFPKSCFVARPSLVRPDPNA